MSPGFRVETARTASYRQENFGVDVRRRIGEAGCSVGNNRMMNAILKLRSRGKKRDE